MSAASCSVVLLVLLSICEAKLCSSDFFGSKDGYRVDADPLYEPASQFGVKIVAYYPCVHVGSEVEVCVDDSHYPEVHVQSLNRATVVRRGSLNGVAEARVRVYCDRYKGAGQAGQAAPPPPRVTVVKARN